MKKVIFLFLVLLFHLSVKAQEYSPELERSARNGDIDAMYDLGACYIDGLGIEQNDEMAVVWLKKAANAGQPDALGLLGDCYLYGWGVRQDYERAFHFLDEAISKGNTRAMNRAGDCFYYGWGVEQNYEEAFTYYQGAAEGGEIEGMVNLGVCYENGEGTEQDYENAYTWYNKAIEEGENGDAYAYIGMWFYEGVVVDQDYGTAVAFFVNSCLEGSQLGFDYLGECYKKGYGVPVDKEKAAVLEKGSIAIEEGDEDLALELFAGIAESVVNDMGDDAGNDVTEAPIDFVEHKTPALEKQPEPVAEPVATAPVEEAPKTVSDVDLNIPQASVTNDNTFVVIIANENYQTESKVEYALNDGNTFKTYCQSVLGIPESNIRMVADATLNNIRGQVDWLHKVADAYKGKATLIFYYAGHGVPDVKSKEAYLLPVDGYASSLITGFRLNDLYTTLSECPSRSTLVFLDACFSGSQRSGEQMKSARAVGIRAKGGTPKGNMVVFSAAQGNETAFPYQEHQHGMFTYYLLKKLKESKGNVTLGELGDYIIDNVQKKSVVLHTESQTPSVKASSAMESTWKTIFLVK